MSDITDRVKKIVVEHLNVDEGKVLDDASFILQPYWVESVPLDI